MCDHYSITLTDKWRCNVCHEVVTPKKKSFKGWSSDGKRRVPLTEWQKMKLSFYRDEKKWLENIQSRKIIEKNGQKMTVLTDSRGNIKGEMPK